MLKAVEAFLRMWWWPSAIIQYLTPTDAEIEAHRMRVIEEQRAEQIESEINPPVLGLFTHDAPYGTPAFLSIEIAHLEDMIAAAIRNHKPRAALRRRLALVTARSIAATAAGYQ